MLLLQRAQVYSLVRELRSQCGEKERKKERKWGSEQSLILDKTGESPGSLPNSPLVTKADDLLTSQTNQRFVLSGVCSNAELTNRLECESESDLFFFYNIEIGHHDCYNYGVECVQKTIS